MTGSETKTLRTKAFEIIADDLQELEEWSDRYRYIIDLGRKLPDFPEALRRDEHLVEGCVSRVWLVASRAEDGTCHFLADSEAQIVRGLVAMLTSMYDGLRAEDVRAVEPEACFDMLGLRQHLSPSRANGLLAMVRRIQALATPSSP